MAAGLQTEYSFKRGDTIRIACQQLNEAGAPEPIVGTIAAEMVSGPLRVELTVTVTDAATGMFEVTLTATQSALLSLRTYYADIQFTTGAHVESTETFKVTILRDITDAG